MRPIAILSVASLLFHAPAWAWGELGHRLVAELAQRQLTQEADSRVRELLRDESVPTLAGVAMWADQLRGSDPERFKATGPWHYVNMPEGTCHFVAARDCPEGACVVGAIEMQMRLLRDPAQPFEVRRDALKFVVHFVGDVHQPFHSSNRPDKGANTFQISLRTDIEPEEYARERYLDGLMATNLHSVWDYYVLASAKLPLGRYADRLQTASRHPTAAARTTASRLSIELAQPDGWARESCELIDERTLYPRSHEMKVKYLKAMRPLAERRVALAGYRLARLLNEIFAAQAMAR